jgi:hypothetical protein
MKIYHFLDMVVMQQLVLVSFVVLVVTVKSSALRRKNSYQRS